MSLTIKDPEVERLARELAEAAGEDIDAAIAQAVKARLEALRAEAPRPETPPGREGLAERLMEIGRHCAAHANKDDRTPDEILGYDENGLPS